MVNANETLYVHVPSPPTFCNGHVPIDLFFSYCLSLNILMTYTPCLQCQNIKALFVQPLLSVKFLPSVVSLLSLSINPFAPILKTSVSHFLQYRSKLSGFDWKCLYVSSLSERQFAEHCILDWQSPSSSSSPMPLYAPSLSSPRPCKYWTVSSHSILAYNISIEKPAIWRVGTPVMDYLLLSSCSFENPHQLWRAGL